MTVRVLLMAINDNASAVNGLDHAIAIANGLPLPIAGGAEKGGGADDGADAGGADGDNIGEQHVEDKNDEKAAEILPVDHGSEERLERLNVKAYEDWCSDDVVDWIIALDQHAYARYEATLRKEFGESDFTGKDLAQIDLDSLKHLCVTNFLHRQKIYSNVRQLINGTFEVNDEQVEGQGGNAQNRTQSTSAKFDEYQIERGDDL